MLDIGPERQISLQEVADRKANQIRQRQRDEEGNLQEPQTHIVDHEEQQGATTANNAERHQLTDKLSHDGLRAMVIVSP